MDQRNVSMNKDLCNKTNELNNGANGGISNGSNKHSSNYCEELELEVPWGVIAGKWWGTRSKQPILALHGSQDNCGSFDRLCPLLPAEIPIFAIDLPGHGKSSPYPKGMQYYTFWDGICLIRRIVRKYSWKKVTLMGHSLGGALTFLYAASFPDEVDKLINIDIAGPPVRSVSSAEKTGWSIDKFLDYEELPETNVPCYSFEQMVQMVFKGYGGSVDLLSAEVLVKRGMAPAPTQSSKSGYYFVRDLRLKVSLLGMFSRDQVLAYAERIKCKVLNIRASPGDRVERGYIYDEVMEVLQQNASLVIYEKVPGTHHLHLVTPDRVAPHIKKFLLEK